MFLITGKHKNLSKLFFRFIKRNIKKRNNGA